MYGNEFTDNGLLGDVLGKVRIFYDADLWRKGHVRRKLSFYLHWKKDYSLLTSFHQCCLLVWPGTIPRFLSHRLNTDMLTLVREVTSTAISDRNFDNLNCKPFKWLCRGPMATPLKIPPFPNMTTRMTVTQTCLHVRWDHYKENMSGIGKH